MSRYRYAYLLGSWNMEKQGYILLFLQPKKMPFLALLPHFLCNFLHTMVRGGGNGQPGKKMKLGVREKKEKRGKKGEEALKIHLFGL